MNKKARVFYEKLDPTGELTLSGGRKATKVMRPRNRKQALAK